MQTGAQVFCTLWLTACPLPADQSIYFLPREGSVLALQESKNTRRHRCSWTLNSAAELPGRSNQQTASRNRFARRPA
ncbi:hypothetical protein P154DRAFT_522015 [Amniculicola lignicola CBS 123094]|uniref:Uncharacterized protein n=1 Tax=Amniculicola lignicola CBS 123094 TaxID=1392246 RepID=A0A6A5WJ25_9PLEO|nr:hypothetical protein P154DRAFT_522015 [Amniculicola lignicola CBS 123094]